MHAYAQSTPSSLPSLPPLPSPPGVASVPVPANPTGEIASTKDAPTSQLAAPVATTMTSPLVSEETLPAASSALDDILKSAQKTDTPLVPAQPLPPVAEKAPEPAATLPHVAEKLPPIPGVAAAEQKQEESQTLPEDEAEVPDEPVKTWDTTLAPSILPPQTNFHYKRVVLPEEIYAVRYSAENRHLPRRVTREDYEGLLFTSIARNDINAARALLNAGTDINATNAYGETPRAFAQRIGAIDMAALLVARGGK